MSFPALHRYTYADYIALEQASNTKHEFLGGEIFAMAGGTPEHAALAVAISSALLERLRGGPCRVFSSDLRVRVLETGLSTYPDVTVVCGAVERDPEGPSGIVNPRVVVEVMSESTERYDRGEKLNHYQKVPSLQAILLVSQDEPSIECWMRVDDTWVLHRVGRGERLAIAAIGAELDVDSIYRDAGSGV